MFLKYLHAIALGNILLPGLMAFINLNEWIKVGILDQVSEYPFEQQEPIAWFYSSGTVYAAYTMAFGFISLALFITALWNYDQKIYKTNVLLLFLNLLICAIQLINTVI